MPSRADAARRPIPAAPPMMVRPAPMPAATYARALGSVGMSRFLLQCFASMCGMRVHSDEDGREQREDERLDEGDQQLQEHDEEAEAQRDGDHGDPEEAADR